MSLWVVISICTQALLYISKVIVHARNKIEMRENKQTHTHTDREWAMPIPMIRTNHSKQKAHFEKFAGFIHIWMASFDGNTPHPYAFVCFAIFNYLACSIKNSCSTSHDNDVVQLAEIVFISCYFFLSSLCCPASVRLVCAHVSLVAVYHFWRTRTNRIES